MENKKNNLRVYTMIQTKNKLHCTKAKYVLLKKKPTWKECALDKRGTKNLSKIRNVLRYTTNPVYIKIYI